MADPTPPDGTIAALLRQLNTLIAEAQRLREQIDKAARTEPIYPDRRRRPRTPDMGGK